MGKADWSQERSRPLLFARRSKKSVLLDSYPGKIEPSKDEGSGVKMDMEYTMRWVRGHVEVFDRSGRFLFSADSEAEAERELDAPAA